jgi:hypothetical protein
MAELKAKGGSKEERGEMASDKLTLELRTHFTGTWKGLVGPFVAGNEAGCFVTKPGSDDSWQTFRRGLSQSPAQQCCPYSETRTN